VEPFFGGGAVFLNLKQQNPDAKYIINDINSELMSLYTNIRDSVDKLIESLDRWQEAYLEIENKEDRKTFFYSARLGYWLIPDSKINSIESSALLYFLMKTSFNGIWQTCEESHGRFGTPAGLLNQKKQIYDKEQLLAWSQILKGVEIRNQDAISLDIPTGSSIIYCDPPYRNSFTSYGTGYDDNKQKELVTTCKIWKNEGAQVFLSNREAGDNFFEDLLPNSIFHRFPITYTAGRRKKTTDEHGTTFAAKSATELLIEI
jgi:DNA adenine methylase